MRFVRVVMVVVVAVVMTMVVVVVVVETKRTTSTTTMKIIVVVSTTSRLRKEHWERILVGIFAYTDMSDRKGERVHRTHDVAPRERRHRGPTYSFTLLTFRIR